MVLKIEAIATYIRALMEECDDLSVCKGTVRRIKEKEKKESPWHWFSLSSYLQIKVVTKRKLVRL